MVVDAVIKLLIGWDLMNITMTFTYCAAGWHWIQNISCVYFKKLLFECVWAAGSVPLKVHSGAMHLNNRTMTTICSCSGGISPKLRHLPTGSDSTNVLRFFSFCNFILPSFLFSALLLLCVAADRSKQYLYEERRDIYSIPTWITGRRATFTFQNKCREGERKEVGGLLLMAI